MDKIKKTRTLYQVLDSQKRLTSSQQEELFKLLEGEELEASDCVADYGKADNLRAALAVESTAWYFLAYMDRICFDESQLVNSHGRALALICDTARYYAGAHHGTEIEGIRNTILKMA